MAGIERKNLFGSVITLPNRPSIAFGVIKGKLPDRKGIEIEDTDVATTVKKTVAAQVVDEGQLSITCRYVPGVSDPSQLIPHVDELVRVTLPLATGQSTAAKWEFTGHITSATGAEMTAEGRCTVDLVFEVNSKPVFTEGT